MDHSTYFIKAGIKPRATCMLSGHFTNWATSPIPNKTILMVKLGVGGGSWQARSCLVPGEELHLALCEDPVPLLRDRQFRAGL